jgi:hypothetical protein
MVSRKKIITLIQPEEQINKTSSDCLGELFPTRVKLFEFLLSCSNFLEKSL